MKKLIIAFAAASVAIAAPAHASSVSVKYDDLNLATPGGQKVLDKRIDRAAREVCGLSERTGTRIASKAAQDCFAQAKLKVAEQVAAVTSANRRGG